jgi:hypothetical protein
VIKIIKPTYPILSYPILIKVLRTVVLDRSISCTPKVFNREELQYGTYEMSLWDYWWDEEGDETLGGDEVLE